MSPTTSDRTYVLPLGFAMTVSMWAMAYFCRLPAVMAPSWLVLSARPNATRFAASVNVPTAGMLRGGRARDRRV